MHTMKTKLLLSFLVVALCGATLLAQDYTHAVLRISDNGDTLVIKPTSLGGGINCVFYAIMGDTASNGSRLNPDRIYKTVRGGVYIYDGPANLDNTVPNVQIVADDGTNQPPLHIKTVNSSGSITRAMFAYYGDMYFKNQYLSNAATNNALDRGMFDTKGSGQTLTFDNCVIEMTDWTIIMNWAVGLSVKMTNCFVHNIGKEPTLEKGVLIDGQSSMPSVYMENNTFIDIGYIIWRRVSYGVGDFYFNHNTVVNSFQNPFQFYTQAYQIMTNNLFINTGVVPDYPGFYPGMQDEDGLPKGIVNIDTVEAAMKTDFWNSAYPVATEADRKMLVQHNNAWWNDKFVTMLASQMTAPAGGNTWASQMITMNSRTKAMFDDDVAYPYLVESDWLNIEPDFTAGIPTSIDDELVQFVITNCNPANPAGGNRCPIWRTHIETDITIVDWPILADLSYSNATLKTAAVGQLPLGDLNWFPDAKATWEGMNESATLIAARDAGTGISGVTDTKTDFGNNIEVLPNPVKELALVKFNLVKSSEVQFIIYNLSGQKLQVTTANFNAGANEYQLDISGLESGVYILQLNTNYNYAGLTTRLSVL